MIAQVMVFILTDGHENASQHFRSADVKDYIATFRDTHAWEFFFAAANQVLAVLALLAVLAVCVCARVCARLVWSRIWHCNHPPLFLDCNPLF